MKKNNLLIIGPFPKPITGVSVSNDLIFNYLNRDKWYLDKINTEPNNKINTLHGKFNLIKFKFLYTYIYSYKIIKSNIVYITIGQTFLGLLKYAPFIFIAKLLDKKIVLHLHGNHLLNEFNELKGIKKLVFSKILKSSSYGIVLSNSLKKNFEPFLTGNKIFELFNFFTDNIKINEIDFNNTKDYKNLKLLFLSNFIEEKGINIFLEAIKIIYDKGIVINVKIAGNKIPNNDIDKLLSELPFVEYCGVVEDKTKRDLFLWSNVFCLPTYYKMEGQPISIIEAMATGSLIVTTKHAGIPDICNEKNALFCEKKDVNDLVDKLLFLSQNLNYIEDVGRYNYKNANILFTQDKFIDETNKILIKCLT